MVQVIGHRGAAGLLPENTMASFQKAIDLGCGMIEFDVHLSSDNGLVIIHDDSVDRTTNGSGKISDLLLSEIRSLDAGNGEKVPHLEEIMDRFRGLCRVNIELKGLGTAGPVAEILLKLIERGQWESSEVLVSSFSPLELMEFSDLETGIPTAILIDRRPWGADVFARDIGCSAVHPNHIYTERDFIDACHEIGIDANVWTVNLPEDISRSLAMGADGLITDRPDIVMERINSGNIG